MYFVYILQCCDQSYYIGSTNDLIRRIHQHNFHKAGARYTKARRPVVLQYHEEFATLSQARKREVQLKKFTRTQKELLCK